MYLAQIFKQKLLVACDIIILERICVVINKFGRFDVDQESRLSIHLLSRFDHLRLLMSRLFNEILDAFGPFFLVFKDNLLWSLLNNLGASVCHVDG